MIGHGDPFVVVSDYVSVPGGKEDTWQQPACASFLVCDDADEDSAFRGELAPRPVSQLGRRP